MSRVSLNIGAYLKRAQVSCRQYSLAEIIRISRLFKSLLKIDKRSEKV